MSAIHNMGNITPVDSFAPNAIAIYGTASNMTPCTPVFDIPILNAVSERITH
jgi:hypothetical protein